MFLISTRSLRTHHRPSDNTNERNVFLCNLIVRNLIENRDRKKSQFFKCHSVFAQNNLTIFCE